MSNDVFDVFLLRGKEEEDGGLTFDPDTGPYHSSVNDRWLS